jgi:hypothetical protein
MAFGREVCVAREEPAGKELPFNPKPPWQEASKSARLNFTKKSPFTTVGSSTPLIFSDFGSPAPRDVPSAFLNSSKTCNVIVARSTLSAVRLRSRKWI